MKLDAILSYTNSLLAPEDYNDYAPNGLQVEGDGRDIHTVAFAVSASLEAITLAKENNADALFVHHGWFWKREDPRLTGIRYERVKALLSSGMALVAYHLPLDNHAEIGNNALLGAALGFTPTGRFGEGDYGWHGTTSETLSVEELSSRIAFALGRMPLVVGPEEREIRRIAWCTGAAQDYLEDAATLGVDAFISGEISERTTYIARETGVTYFSCGHDATERFGIQALAKKILEEFGINVLFIDVENPV